MLQPKKQKFRKSFRGKRRGFASRGTSLAFGEYGLKAQESGWFSATQIEAGRRAITHSLRKGGRVWVRVFPDKPITQRAAGKRMGGGKGDVSEFVAVITPGRVLFEVAGAAKEVVLEGFANAASKLPFKTRVIGR